MQEIKYIHYSILLLLAAVTTFIVMKPMVQSQWIKIETKEPAYGSNDSYEKPVVKNVAGKNLFSANCATCHAFQKTLTGPALADVDNRGPWTKRKNLVKWVHNPASFIATNPYAKELPVRYNSQIMPSFPQMTEQEIAQIFDYIKEASVLHGY
jgi:mono/diheme cytochrome c family protein